MSDNSFCVIVIINSYEPQEFSSEPSGQFFSPLQNSPRSIQDLSPQDNSPSYSNGKYKRTKKFNKSMPNSLRKK
ncbi:Uncharacterized protein FWK35_00002457 [Aphis craccivora]|uniref:Uncharacterized protein n=1 Tax=Aphis craccivora TaxID=307492 RepID=A0A6G0ZMK0_APHCR|nr:Uncharacterized protein FWK35_00002457 [Aphis craccivora]